MNGKLEYSPQGDAFGASYKKRKGNNRAVARFMKCKGKDFKEVLRTAYGDRKHIA